MKKNITEFYNDLCPDSILFYVNNGKIDSAFYLDDSNQAIVRIDAESGETLYTIEADYTPYRMNLSYTKDGQVDGIVVIGNDYTNEYLVKYNLSGEEVFRRVIPDYEQYTIKSSKLPNGTYDGYISTATSLGDKIGTAVIKYDLSGNIVNTNIFSENIYWVDYSINNYAPSGIQNGLIFVSRVDEGLLQLKFSYPTYDIVKEATEEGTISVDNNAAAGEVVKVGVTPKEGYILKKITVLDENGKEIEVRDDGTFIMPEGKVTVSAVYSRITNPNTVSACLTIVAIIVLMYLGTFLVLKHEKKNITEN